MPQKRRWLKTQMIKIPMDKKRKLLKKNVNYVLKTQITENAKYHNGDV